MEMYAMLNPTSQNHEYVEVSRKVLLIFKQKGESWQTGTECKFHMEHCTWKGYSGFFGYINMSLSNTR